MVFLDIRNFLSSQQFEAVVDENGVPIYATAGGGQDLKAAVDLPGHYAVARPTAGGGHTVYELDRTFSPVASYRLDGAASSTDFHDSQLLPGGGALLLGYQGATRDGTAYTDALIQVVDAQGHATFTWNSKDHVDPSETYATAEAGGDYAHVNALQMMANGDVVASFRNLSQVMRIATRPHGRFAAGDVVWRLGGREGDFTFPGDPAGGRAPSTAPGCSPAATCSSSTTAASSTRPTPSTPRPPTCARVPAAPPPAPSRGSGPVSSSTPSTPARCRPAGCGSTAPVTATPPSPAAPSASPTATR
jgi:hypothetical protein